MNLSAESMYRTTPTNLRGPDPGLGSALDPNELDCRLENVWSKKHAEDDVTSINTFWAKKMLEGGILEQVQPPPAVTVRDFAQEVCRQCIEQGQDTTENDMELYPMSLDGLDSENGVTSFDRESREGIHSVLSRPRTSASSSPNTLESINTQRCSRGSGGKRLKRQWFELTDAELPFESRDEGRVWKDTENEMMNFTGVLNNNTALHKRLRLWMPQETDPGRGGGGGFSDYPTTPNEPLFNRHASIQAYRACQHPARSSDDASLTP